MMPRLPFALSVVPLMALVVILGAVSPSRAHQQPHMAPLTGATGFSTLDDQILYFVMVDRFANGDLTNDRPGSPDPRGAFHGGDLEGLREKLPYLADLGVTALWLTPLARQVETTVKGAGFPDAAYHGYWPDDLGGIEPRFGSAVELSALIEQAHHLGMKVILDVVINHVGYGATLSARTDLIRSRESCPAEDERTERTMCLLGLPDFKTEGEAARRYIVHHTVRWVRDFDIDGFRLDALKHVDPELISELRAAVEIERGARPFLFLGEDWGAEPSPDAIAVAIADGRADTLIDFSFHGLVEGFLNGRMRAEALAHHLDQRHASRGPPMAHFIDSHDVTSLLARLPRHVRHRYPLAAVLQMSVWGMPIVTWGDELGRIGGRWPDNRPDMDWEALHRPVQVRTHRLWRSLIQWRRARPALQSKLYRTVTARTTSDGGGTLIFQRGMNEQSVLIGVRRGPSSVLEALPVAPDNGKWCLLFSTAADVLLWEPARDHAQQSVVLPADTGVVLGHCSR